MRLNIKPVVFVRNLLAGQIVRLHTGQRAKLVDDVHPKDPFVRVFPYSTASKRQSHSPVPIPITYIVLLEPDIKVCQEDKQETPVPSK